MIPFHVSLFLFLSLTLFSLEARSHRVNASGSAPLLPLASSAVERGGMASCWRFVARCGGMPAAASSAGALSVSCRTIKNLHQYPHARYKSLVRDRLRFARNWHLQSGNNYELVHDVGHEREAMENFGVYRDDSDRDEYVLSTSRLEDLPPNIRLNAITALMAKRWKVKDGNRGFDKAKMMLSALECFSEMRLAQMIKPFDELPEPDQDTFLQYVESCSQFSQACSHSHPDAVAILIRAAQICDDMRCESKRDEMLVVAERACDGLGRAYHFSRPKERSKPGAILSTILPPSHTEMEAERVIKEDMKMKRRFHDKPWLLEKEKKVLGTFVTARNRTQLLHPMKSTDPRMQLLREPRRPERDGCSGGPDIPR
eukprot:gene6729-4824_t